MRYAQLVMGPAGSGKSTYCNVVQKHGEAIKRMIHIVNLDPAAEQFDYNALADVRNLIHLDDAMEDKELNFGPNGGLVFCMEFLARNFDWLKKEISDVEDDYIIFDCPGQIELYTHVPVMKQLVEALRDWNFYVCGVFLLDSQFLIETSKYFSGVLVTLSTMVNLEIPQVNVLSKMDLLDKRTQRKIEKFLEPDMEQLQYDIEQEGRTQWSDRFKKLSGAIGGLIEDYGLVNFLPLDIRDEESVASVLAVIDNAIQYGEDLEPKEPPDLTDDDNGKTGMHPFSANPYQEDDN